MHEGRLSRQRPRNYARVVPAHVFFSAALVWRFAAVEVAAAPGLPRLHWDQRNLEVRIPADHPHLERVVKGPAHQHSVDVVYRSYGAFVERDNEVSLAQPSNRGWTVGFDGDELHHLRCRQRMAPRDEAVDR